jgi:hypothetical protein
LLYVGGDVRVSEYEFREDDDRRRVGFGCKDGVRPQVSLGSQFKRLKLRKRNADEMS